MFVKLPNGVRLARMSSGTWCLVRDLGLVKGGKGMRHFEPIMTFSLRGLRKGVRDWLKKRELAASTYQASANTAGPHHDFPPEAADAAQVDGGATAERLRRALADQGAAQGALTESRLAS